MERTSWFQVNSERQMVVRGMWVISDAAEDKDRGVKVEISDGCS